MKYKSVAVFRNSDQFKHITDDTTTKVNTRILRSMRIEDMIYSDLRAQVTIGLDEIEAVGTEKLSTFPSLIRDVFQTIYSLKLFYNDVKTLTAITRQFNTEILDCVINSDKFHELKSLCEGRELPAYEAVLEFAECILSKIDDLLNTDSGSNAAKALDTLELQQEQLKTQILEAMESGDPSAEDSILSMAASLSSKEQQMERLSEIVGQNIRKNKGIIQTAVASAAEKAQEVSDIIKSWGNADSSPQAIQQNTELLRRVQTSQELRDIMKYLGRYREMLDNAHKSSYTYGRGDKYDLVLGNDFTRAVSSEYAYLAMPETVQFFIRKVQRNVLKQYRKRERISKGFGDIVVCIDESSSMAGDNIAWAKAVALVLLEFAAKNKRSCAIIRFASANLTVTHIYKGGEHTTEDVFVFAESFLNGGTDFETPLTKATELIEREGFENADIMFITDGECSISDKFTNEFRDKGRQFKFIVTGIIIDADDSDMSFSIEQFCEKVYHLSELTGDDIAADIIRRKF